MIRRPPRSTRSEFYSPTIERHCVEGGEFIIAWLSHSSKTGSNNNNNNNNSNKSDPARALDPASALGANNSSTSRAFAALPAIPTEMQSSSSTPASASAATAGSGSNRSFINKPARGWLHSDQLVVREGITYFVRYIGCLEVNTSMKSLDFDTRSQIAKECINLVCETAGLKTVDKKRKVDRRIQRILGEVPHMEHAGSDVALTINSGCLRITTLEANTVVACHDMPNISFASGGDPDTLDFVAYVAKDNNHGRACYVLECGGGLAQDVITTIGQAFELRFKEYLKRAPRPATETVTDSRDAGGAGHSAGAAPAWTPDDPEYYNDLPDVPLVTKAEVGGAAGGPPPYLDHEYVNGIMGSSSDFRNAPPVNKDPFDMHPFSSALPSPLPTALLPPHTSNVAVSSLTGLTGRLAATTQRGPLKGNQVKASSHEIQLSQEIWFHGAISRKEAEDLLKNEGDFLVRESQGSQGQYVLTGMQSGHHKHLLLVDPEGVVRTKDRTFESVSHLINYHRNNVLPIISAESVLLLKKPVPRMRHS
nr:EOG090X098F [Polyphemus pediculus]